MQPDLFRVFGVFSRRILLWLAGAAVLACATGCGTFDRHRQRPLPHAPQTRTTQTATAEVKGQGEVRESAASVARQKRQAATNAMEQVAQRRWRVPFSRHSSPGGSAPAATNAAGRPGTAAVVPSAVTHAPNDAAPVGIAVPSVPTGQVANDTGPYRVHSGDSLHLQVAGEDDISGDFKVAADGTIVHPLLGRVSVEGSTAPELEQMLTQALAKDYLVNPKLFVQVRTSVVRRVILFGEVKTPGVYELPVGDRFTLLQLIAKAGGFTELAAADRVCLVRRQGGDDKTIKVNVADLLRGRGEGTDIELQPYDVITVPQTVF